MPTEITQRFVQITFLKCGSQWVRDVLTAPEVVAVTGVRLDGRSPILTDESWPAQEGSTFLGPLYNATPQDWERAATADDRAVVVLRDPRDRLMSWIFSFAYSHVENPNVRTIRDPLLALSMRERVLLGMFEFSRFARMFRLWKDHGTARGALVTSYEAIVADQAGEFRRIVEFLGWRVPGGVLDAAIDQLSFEKRSGRQRGDVNIYSHYRTGKAGDWRNFFDRRLGAIWEGRFPGLLAMLGYENGSQWFESLPESVDTAAVAAIPADPRIHQLEAQITRLTEQADELRRANAELHKALGAR